MIKSIEHLQNFGIYRDHNGGAGSGVPPFKKRNLVYGWNYSGKTTLSRLFQLLQFPDRTSSHPGCQFSVKFEDGSEATERDRSGPHPIRVFNRDFIAANFREGNSAPAIFIVGEENIALRIRLAVLRDSQATLKERVQARTAEATRIERDDNAAGSTLATNVGQILGVRDFRRPDLDRRILEVRTNPATHLMAEERLHAAVDTFRSGDQFDRIPPFQFLLPDLAGEIQLVRLLLQRTASFDAIEGLRENRALEDWLRMGLNLHDSPGNCRFCEGQLTQERLDRLQRHFSEASLRLLAELDQKLAQLRAMRFEPPRLDEARFIPEVRQRVIDELLEINDWLRYAEEVRDSLVAVLESKRTSLESALEWSGPEDRLEERIALMERLSESVRLHDEKIRDIGEVKRQARLAIERHHAASHFRDQDLATREARVELLRKRNRRTLAAIQRLEETARGIEAQIDRAALGADRFMELVAFLLRGSDIHVESRGESEFQLMRGSNPADNLSDGEVTAIAFAYFVTSLEGEGEDLSTTIVYVDDPISSLDSNHVYAVYSLITKRLQNSLQIFVSTHNSEFFGLLKELWLNPRGSLAKGSEAFYVRRQADDHGAFSRLEVLPPLLRRFKSEYEFIFSQIHAFANNPSPSDHEAYTTPNLLRRFLEAYLGFRKPCTAAWHAKLDLIFDSEEECGEIQKLLDDASHLQSTGRALQEPAFVPSTQSCAQRVLRGIEAKDPLHYESLIAVIS